MVDRLQEAVTIRSLSGSPGEVDIQHWFHERFKETGLATDFWPIDLETTTAHPDFPGMEVERSEGWGLVGTWGGDQGPTLVLNGHVDIVPAGDLTQWESDPYVAVCQDGKIFGRGTCDMKGGLLTALSAIDAIRAAGLNLKGKVLVQSVIGEEDGGLGTFSTILRGHTGDAAIIMEPTGLGIVPACAGALTFRLRLAGHATHAGLRTEGVSVIEKFWLVWKALEELEQRRNANPHPYMASLALPYPINIGLLRAGNWPSSVPDELMAEGRYGVALGESPADARQDLEETIRRVNSDQWLSEHPITVEWFGGQFASGQLDEDHPFLNLVADVHTRLHGDRPEVGGVPWGSDLRLLSQVGGIPTIHYGPGDLRVCHAVNEFVPISELEASAQTLALTILRFCGHHQ
jgi:acetylornithine deacetylase